MRSMSRRTLLRQIQTPGKREACVARIQAKWITGKFSARAGAAPLGISASLPIWPRSGKAIGFNGLSDTFKGGAKAVDRAKS